jgi:hypothetical protein
MASQPEEDNAEDEAPRKCGTGIVVAHPATAASVEATARLIPMEVRRLAEHGGHGTDRESHPAPGRRAMVTPRW